MSLDYRKCIETVPYLPPNPIVFDVGCNINKIVEEDNAVWIENWNDDFTLLFLDRFKDAKCYAIEPLHWQEFENRWGDDERVELIKLALSDKNGQEFIFYPGDRHVLSSFYMQDDFLGEPLHTEKVECKTLDTLCKELSLDHIDYLKIDAEGAELKIIQGSKNLLTRHNIKYVQFEYGLPDKNIPPAHEVSRSLKYYGYEEVLTSGREQLWTHREYYDL